MKPIEATAPLSITLQAHQWNILLGVLAEGPYRVAAPLIAEITAQAQTQQAPAGSAGQEDSA